MTAVRNLRAIDGGQHPRPKHTPVLTANRSPVAEGTPAPCDLDAEGAVLGALLLKPDELDAVRDILPPTSSDTDAQFYSDANRLVYKAIVQLSDAGERVDIVTVAGWLRARDLIGRAGKTTYLGELLDKTPSIANIREHAYIVRDCALQRAAIRMHWEALAEAYGDVGDRQAWRERQLARHELLVERGSRLADAMSIKDALREAGEAMVANSAGGGSAVPLLRTGLMAWDRVAGGLYLGKIAGLVAESGEGKTSLSLQLCYRAAGGVVLGKKSRGLVISIEMSEAEQAMRVAQQRSKVDMTRLHKGGDLGGDAWAALARATTSSSQLPVKFVRRKRLTPSQACNIIGVHAALAKREGEILGPVVVDHLHDMDLADEQRENPRGGDSQWLRMATKRFEEAAERYNVALILVAQGNRDGQMFMSPRSMQVFDTLCTIAKPDNYQHGDTLRELRFPKLRALGDKNTVSEVHYHGGCYLFSDRDDVEVLR